MLESCVRGESLGAAAFVAVLDGGGRLVSLASLLREKPGDYARTGKSVIRVAKARKPNMGSVPAGAGTAENGADQQVRPTVVLVRPTKNFRRSWTFGRQRGMCHYCGLKIRFSDWTVDH